ncbi:RNA polymerase sigma factor [Pseudodonghicola flavimaris]|uniref:RNA polymerase sigma factor n=1 Tax=Pseudodonghicola flavimaris TaxID=3050036 RepID=A0ABT7EUY9_9RHOB|nr:RNA polymerase sigma factor [Pseudodonghicola flavimaris]MDK3016157.1 RNA polymerase sigma factor [Pseudodonghicola flavimaris]
MSDLSPQDHARTLVAAMAAGDRTALSGLIRLYGGGIQAFAGRSLGNVADGEDIAQEVFLRAWKQAARYDPRKAAVSTWLYRIAVNLCIDQRRRRGVRLFLGLETLEAAAEPPDPAPDAAQTVEARNQLARLTPVLEDLPDRQRMAILLRAVAEMDTAEIAQTMGTSPGAVEQLLARARSRLRRDLQEGPRGHPRADSDTKTGSTSR